MSCFYKDVTRLPIVQDCLEQLPALTREVSENWQLFSHATEIEGFNDFRGNDDTYELETPGWYQIFFKWNAFKNCLPDQQYRKFNDALTRNRLACPVAASIVERYDGQLDAFGFSLVQPGTHIPMHKDLPGAVRIHVCILEDSQCQLFFDGRGYGLNQGGTLGFDSTYDHELWHLGVKERVHIIFDVYTEYAEQFLQKTLT